MFVSAVRETVTATQMYQFTPSASVAVHWEPCRRWIVPPAPDLSPRPDLKAPIHLLLLISSYCSSFACSSTSQLCTALLLWLARRNISACLQNRIHTQAAATSSCFFFFSPLQHDTIERQRIFREQWLFTRILYCITKLLKNKRRNEKKKSPGYHKRDKNVSFKMSELWW